MSDSYGPALPPGLQSKATNKVVGPELPPHLCKQLSDENEASGVIGPALPPGMSSVRSSIPSIGPALPPGMSQGPKKLPGSDEIGPALPPHLRLKVDQSDKVNVIGPSLPLNITEKDMQRYDSSSNDDTDVIGPMPSEMLTGDESVSTMSEIESRARNMKDRLEGKKDNKEDKVSRESWMTELPSAGLSQCIGLQARTFKSKAGPDLSDRSAWTDTPADRERKAKEESSRKRSYDVVQSEKDQKMSEDVSKYNKSSRPESLLEMHQKKIKKEKKKMKEEPKERRPFDREVDLQVNKFDDAQRKAIIKKSRNLDTRFSHSGGSQFL